MPSFFRYGQKIQAVRLVSPAGWFKLCSFFVLLLMWMSVGEVHVSLAQSSAQESSALSKEVEQSQTQAGTDTEDTARVDSSRLPTGRSLQPHGLSLEFHGRPVDLVVYKNWLLVKDRGHLRVVDIETWKEIQVLRSRGGASLTGLCVDRDGVVYFSNSKQEVHRFETTGDAAKPYRFRDSIQFSAGSFPCGLALSEDQKKLFVCLSKANRLGVVDLPTAKVEKELETDIAPYEVLVDGASVVVSCLGGPAPKSNEASAPSGGSETRVDARGVALGGSINLFSSSAVEGTEDEKKSVGFKRVPTGRHPMQLAKLGPSLVGFVNTNDDSLQRIRTTEATDLGTQSLRPDPNLPFGSMPSDLMLWQPQSDQGILLTTLAGNNAVGVFASDDFRLLGLVPTGWYPIAMARDSQYLFVANVKGRGSRAKRRELEKGRNSHDHLGTVQRIPLADLQDEKRLAELTATSRSLSRLPQILRNLESASSESNLSESNLSESEQVSQVVPERLGQPSKIRHVIYVIKENRTFDQVFGDVQQARSESKLCLFPESVTPNHHALAKRFGLLDNYYCNGVLSADGHSWATEANVTPYLERAFGGFARSYTFGDDPLTYSSTGFLWDRFLDAGLSFRNYGEFNYSEPPKGMNYQDVFQAYTEGKPIEFSHKIGIQRLRDFSCPDYPGWNMLIPDVLRMERFLKEFREFEAKGELPHLMIVYLPQDHLGGGITSRSHMADNDQALGQLVDAVSHSRFWKHTAIFVNEDDPQNGFDHIDGHRSLCLVISPYSRPGINNRFYNQTSVIRTILHIFGLAPLNQQDASMPLMANCFQETPDFRPYQRVPTEIPLNEAPGKKKSQTALEQEWRAILATVPIARTGMKTEKDEDNLNRFIWHEVKGWKTEYPVEFAGAHGKGLHLLGLTLGNLDTAVGDEQERTRREKNR